ADSLGLFDRSLRRLDPRGKLAGFLERSRNLSGVVRAAARIPARILSTGALSCKLCKVLLGGFDVRHTLDTTLILGLRALRIREKRINLLTGCANLQRVGVGDPDLRTLWPEIPDHELPELLAVELESVSAVNCASCHPGVLRE